MKLTGNHKLQALFKDQISIR